MSKDIVQSSIECLANMPIEDATKEEQQEMEDLLNEFK